MTDLVERIDQALTEWKKERKEAVAISKKLQEYRDRIKSWLDEQV